MIFDMIEFKIKKLSNILHNTCYVNCMKNDHLC